MRNLLQAISLCSALSISSIGTSIDGNTALAHNETLPCTTAPARIAFHFPFSLSYSHSHQRHPRYSRMANFDRNTWYQILWTSSSSFQGNALNFNTASTEGAVYCNTTDTSSASQQWQIFPYNSTYYILRTKASSALGYLVTYCAPSEPTPGSTVPAVFNASIADDSMFWQISPWGDGTFYFTNAANGTSWHMYNKLPGQYPGGGLMAMTSNISMAQVGQEFSFSALGSVDDVAYSSVVVSSEPSLIWRDATDSV